jgi:nitronate monooxygenase
MQKFQTSLTRLLNIDIPIILAPMANVVSPELAAAVSNAGGLGMLSATWREIENIRQVIHKTRSLTRRPFGVNLVLAWPQAERLAICLEEGVPIISFSFGDSSQYIDRVHAAGAVVMHTIASAAEARLASEAGVDILIAQGWEAGGHVWGKVATFPLVPHVVDAVTPKPVVAAGGIADGRGVAAAFMLGAAGVWVGTRFLLSEEALIHTVYQQKLLQAAETDTVYGSLFDIGWSNSPHRSLRNDTIEQWEAAGYPPSGQRPNESEVIGTYGDGNPIRRYESSYPEPGATGQLESMCLYAGQGVGLASRVQPAAEIVQTMAEEAARLLGSCQGTITFMKQS